MSSFLLYPRSMSLPTEEVNRVFSLMGLKPAGIASAGDFDILLFKKGLTGHESFTRIERDMIISAGTFVYRKRSHEEGMKLFLQDFKKGQIDEDEVIGQFALLIIHDDHISLITDRMAVQNVYVDEKKKILSPSMLALCSAIPGELSINGNSITEILLTGGLVGPETVFKEIRRVEPFDSSIFEGVNLFKLPGINYSLKKSSRDKMITRQLDNLDHYFTAISGLAEENGVISGLTGGYDSRLLMCFAERHFKNVHYFTHWRKGDDKEVQIAKRLAEQVQKELRQTIVKYPEDMTPEEALDTLEQAFYHNDGHIRTQLYWHEYYNTMDYARQVFGQGALALNGIGGELYRNYEKMIRPRWNYKSWLKYEILYRNSDNLFTDKAKEKEFIEHFSHKIHRKLSIDHIRFIDKFFLKRYHNEVYNVSNRTVRSVMENKLIDSLSPFVEPVVSFKAYEAVPALGNSMSFQTEMIKKINPELAGINSHYGYDLYAGEPLSTVMQSYVKEMLPRKYFFKLYQTIRKSKNNDFYIGYKHKFEFMTALEDRIHELDLPLDMERLKRIKHTGWQLISLGFFLKQMENKIKI